MNFVTIIAVVCLCIALVGTAYYFMTNTSTTTTPSNKRPPGPSPSSYGICKESDPTKCCGSSKKCQQSESACQCSVGQSYDCKQNKCVANCVCPNGTPAVGKECGNVYGATKCTKCNTGYSGGVHGCWPYTCGSSGGTKWETDCPGGMSCCHVALTSQYKCCSGGCGFFSTCSDGDPTSPDKVPGWSR